MNPSSQIVSPVTLVISHYLYTISGIQGGLDRWSVIRGEAEGNRPFSMSNSIPVTRVISHYLFYYTSIMVKVKDPNCACI